MEIRGTALLYRGVAAGTDLAYRPSATGVQEQIWLRTRAAGTGEWRFKVASSGVRLTDDGATIQVRRGKTTVATIPDGVVRDATGASASVDVSVDSGDLVVRVNRDWLGSASRRYPVVVDPDLRIDQRGFAVQDTYLDSGNVNQNYSGDGGIRVGYSGGREYVGLMRFDMPAGLASHQVLYAEWSAHVQSVSKANAKYVLYPASNGWDQRTVAWSSRPNHRSESAIGLSNANVRVTRDITTWAQAWSSGAWPNYGIVMDTGGDTSSHTVFKSAENYQDDLDPELSLTYANADPATPDRNQAGPRDGARITTATPTLSMPPVSDPNGDPVRYWFRVAQSADGESGQVLNSGWLGSSQWTVPPGTLRDGQTYYWKMFVWDGLGDQNPRQSSFPPTSMKVDFRLGDQQSSAYDSVGPVKVNLTNGNLALSAASPNFKAVGGDIGLTYAYNSQAQSQQGLTGQYFNQCNGTVPPDLLASTEPDYVRTDPTINFNWSGSPAPGLIDANDFCVRWTGYLTMPRSNRYCFEATRDDGVVVKIDGQIVVNDWRDQATGGPPPLQCIDLLSDKVNTLEVMYYNHGGTGGIGLYVGGPDIPLEIVNPSRLSLTPQSLPAGWSVSADTSGGLAYSEVRKTPSGLTLLDPTGKTYEYRATSAGAYAPPPGEDDVVFDGIDPGGTPVYVVQADDGLTYTFNNLGRLLRAESATDDVRPAAARFSYAGDSGHLQSITDPVSNRSIQLTYSIPNGSASNCNPPSGFSRAPSGLLCRVDYWDGTKTDLLYNDIGQLAAIVDPGNKRTDFSYVGNYIVDIRDSLNNDAGGAREDRSYNTTIDYDPNNGYKAVAVTQPQPIVSAPRPRHTYVYGAGQTDLHVAGLPEPNGYVRRINYNEFGQVITNRGLDGLAATQQWDIADRLLSSTDSAGRRTTTLYDYANRSTDTYGPMPAACFGADRRPIPYCAPATPHTSTDYDGGMKGLAATYWSNPTLSGAPAAHAFGVGSPGGELNVNWSSGAPPGVPNDNFSGRFTGSITFPDAGAYQFNPCADDKVRLYIDDTLVSDGWATGGCAPVGTFAAAGPNETHRIRVDYAELGGQAALALGWTPPSGQGGLVPGSALSPRYGLVTRTTSDDSTSGSPPEVTANEYAKPELGLITAEIKDPDGMRLRTTRAYETPGQGHFFRPVSRTLPAGNASTYLYYGNTQQAVNPCRTGGVANQSGLPASTRGPSPTGNGAGSRIESQIYDQAGRIVASRVGGESWTCITYDARGRITSKSYPARPNQAARMVTYDHQVGGNPLVTSVQDSVGTIVTGVDRLGRTIYYSDASNKVTSTSYDQAGRITESSGPAGALHTDYYPNGRVSVQYLDGKRIAVPGYNDATGELSSVNYEAADATHAAGNSSTGAFSYGSTGKLQSVSWGIPTGAVLTANTVTYSQSGRVVADQTISSSGLSTTSSYSYDTAGRLTEARQPGHDFRYGFGDTNSCVAKTAGRNSNRTTFTDAPGGITTPRTYCYDYADRLASTNDSRYSGIAYDSHGNTSRLGTLALGYDSAGRHSASFQGSVAIHYTRDAANRVISRSIDNVTTKYYYDGPDDAPVATASGTSIERYIALPGGASVTKRSNGKDVWSYPNVHGDITATADETGKLIALHQYDPYGSALRSNPDNSASSRDFGWLGGRARLTDAGIPINLIDMGARSYSPVLGRFLQVDPVEGGSANDYDYTSGDPVNSRDLDGLSPLDSYISGLEAWATRRAQVRSGTKRDNGRTNALRHCLISCIAVARFGIRQAWKALIAHEGGQAGLTNPTRDTIADINNNMTGTNIGNANHWVSKSECERKCCAAKLDESGGSGAKAQERVSGQLIITIS